MVPFLRLYFLGLLMLVGLVLGWAGFRGDKSTQRPLQVFPDMDDQAKVKFQASSAFFADGVGARPPVPGTIPQGLAMATKPAADLAREAAGGFSNDLSYYHTGRFGDYWGDGLPEELVVNEALLRRGAERYNIYCAVCHGYSGDGKGVTSQYGIVNIANFHLPQFADPTHAEYRVNGRLFNTITHGQGLMGPYGSSIQVRDRWAIIAYLRALQMSQAAAAASAATTPPPPGAAGTTPAPAQPPKNP
jgi:mono/diheme cytochrome c family protein